MSNNPKTCKYSYNYSDIKTKEYKDYQCDRDTILDSTFCAFHHSSYHETDPANVRKLFLDELTSNTNSKFFIGCNLPSVKISKITPSPSIYFVNTKFHGDVHFLDIVFNSVDFTKCDIQGRLEFTNVNVDVNLVFKYVRDDDSNLVTTFKRCNFKNVEFISTKFKFIKFLECGFSHANFRYTKFDTMIVDECSFAEKTDFGGAAIMKHGEFQSTVFHNAVKFHHAELSGITVFKDVDFKEQKLVRFGGDLSKISFLRTDITRIMFDENTVWGKDDRYLIYGAQKLEKNPSEEKLSPVLTTYRNLRENYEFRLMYDEAGQFFIKEMDLKKKYCLDQNNETKPRKFRGYFSLIYYYNVLCQYGESFNRVVLWAVAIFSASVIYFACYPDVVELYTAKPLGDINYSEELKNNLAFRLQVSMERTLASFFQADKNHLADYIVRLSSLTVLGALFVVLRRKLERKFRH
ncbi:MAG: hypothetical protein OXC46_11465 [Thaumarchaeota archaeon]|nr:hypothetical protein [Nitrososphaerota archaeon]